MDKQYSHANHEDQIYHLWEKSGGFSPIPNPQAKPFTIIMPPPNANDPLHIGHTMFVSVEDILIRYHRMLGDTTLWLPGTDHAGIETQFVFEKKLAKEGKSRFDFDRKTLYDKIVNYVEENSKVAINQMQRLGASADWSKTKYTLDLDIQKLVLETFQKLHQDNLVYRDLRLVNYCTKCGTSFSELEAVHVEKNDPLYYMKYGPFTLATVRPETKFGDTALAVNPGDKRYTQWIGKEVEAEGLMGKFKIKVIADEYVDPEFGTGVVKITPAHDPNDFAIWQRHLDEIPGPIQVIDFNGKLNTHAGKYQGLNVLEARKQVVADLQTAGLIVKIDDKYIHNIGTCYRCGRTLEPLPLPQFYIKVKPLTEKVLSALDKKQFKVYGAGYTKILRHWLENLHDWNISRQIVWGIRIPVWYNYKKYPQIRADFIDGDITISGEIGELIKPLSSSSGYRVFYGNTNRAQKEGYKDKAFSINQIVKGLQKVKASPEVEYVVSLTSPGEDYIQETDTFDTWFSSSQWPFVTLMASGVDDFNRFYPTTVMETAYDILMFWVMRMLMMGLYKTGQVPFKHIYLHGLIRDQKGQKMSKSKGNVINPLTVIDKYGADALRMALVIRSTPGIDKNVGEQDIRAMRNLTNKIWNSARYILLKLEQPSINSQLSQDQNFYQHLNQVIADVTHQLNTFKVGLAAETCYNQFWHWFCDECIEANKQGSLSDQALSIGLLTFLKLFHPFVPFVTEAVYQQLKLTPLNKKLSLSPELMNSTWPSTNS